MMEFWSKQLKEEVSKVFRISARFSRRHRAQFSGVAADEGADSADGQSLPPEGLEQEAAVVLPLAPLSQLGPGQSSTRHRLSDLAVPRLQRSVQEQPVSLSPQH